MKIVLFGWGIAALLFVSCGDDTAAAKREANYKPHVVKLWSGGNAVSEWRSTERPESHREHGNRTSILGFVDAETGTYVMLRGTISVEQTE